MVDHFSIMVIAVLIAILAMMLLSGPLTSFINSHPAIVILALSFLLVIGFSLFAEGWGFKIPKEYLYAAIVLSVVIETLNQIASRNRVKRAAAWESAIPDSPRHPAPAWRRSRWRNDRGRVLDFCGRVCSPGVRARRA